MSQSQSGQIGLTKMLKFRVCPDDENRIKSRAKKAGLSISEYIRRMSCSGKIVVKESQADIGLIRELNKIGVNLNQMVRKFNATGKAPGVSDLSETLSRINAYLDQAERP